MITISQRDLEDACCEADIDPEDSLRMDYSGRGMYGKECLGVVGTAGDLIKFVAAVADHQDDTVQDLMDEWGEPRQDQMGRDMIYYWPGVRVSDGDEDEED